MLGNLHLNDSLAPRAANASHWSQAMTSVSSRHAETHTLWSLVLRDAVQGATKACGYGSRVRGDDAPVRHISTFSRRECARVVHEFFRPSQKGRGECRVLDAPAVSRAKWK